MARPTKTGLDYYPMDVGFLRDKKVRLLWSEFGASSVIFVLYVFGKIYEGAGYFLAWDKDECLLAADELHKPPTYISEVLRGCLSRSIFDDRVFQMFGILTSAGIQRRYLRGCEKRGDISVIEEYWLLDADDKKSIPSGIQAKLTFLSVSGGKNPVNSPGNPVNSPGNSQSKVKESKVKYNAASGSADVSRRIEARPKSVEAVAAFAKECGSNIDPQDWFSFHAKNGWQINGEPIRDWKAAFRASEGWARWKRKSPDRPEFKNIPGVKYL